VHFAERVTTVYVLTADPKSPLMPVPKGSNSCSTRIGPINPEDRNYLYQYENCLPSDLLNGLQFDQPTVDKTGLTGRYNFTLLATPSFKLQHSSEPGDIAVEDAVRKLGMKLEQKKEPILTLFVDDFARPTDN
jgi:uncharacterized protein (TIGR03435 family)